MKLLLWLSLGLALAAFARLTGAIPLEALAVGLKFLPYLAGIYLFAAGMELGSRRG